MVIPQLSEILHVKNEYRRNFQDFYILYKFHRNISTNTLILDINDQLFVIFVISPFLKKNADQKILKIYFFCPAKDRNYPLLSCFVKSLYSSFKGP